MIGPAGTFAAPKAESSRWRVVARMKDGKVWDRQTCPDEAEAHDLAARMGTVHGQKAWAMEVFGPDGYVTTYKGGKEMKSKRAEAVKP